MIVEKITGSKISLIFLYSKEILLFKEVIFSFNSQTFLLTKNGSKKSRIKTLKYLILLDGKY